MHAVLAIATCLTMGAGEPSIRLVTSDDRLRVTVVAELTEEALNSLPEGSVKPQVAERLLSLRLVGDGGELGPPIFGVYHRSGSKLQLTPRYRLVPGTRYRASLVVSASRTITRDYLASQSLNSRPAVVERVYPTVDTVPANHLKFYIYFSKPMREGRAIFDRMHLVDESGERVADPWRRTELWTADARRLTLWIHPGRVKTGVNLREEIGPVLEPGRRYTLVIDASVRDASGQPLAKSFKKRFTTVAADRLRPLPEQWRITAPSAGTRNPIRLRFPESLDYALLHRVIEVRDFHDALIAGSVEVGDEEKRWSFVPDLPWSKEEYSLSIDPILEDLAGNTPVRVFETDLRDKPVPAPQLTLRFQPH